jgi:CHAD domain-containing protein
MKPGAYSTRLALALRPEMRSDDALAGVLLFLLDIMELNLEGVLRDLDTEFLHDFRIACRRSRTLLTQVRGLFPARELPRFKRTFAWLSRCTGVQRDLDVMLLAFPQFQHMVPGSMRSALAPLRSLLEERRAAAHAELVRELRSRRFRTFLRDWRRFLQRRGPRREAGAAGERPLGETAEISLRRVARELAKAGKQIGSGEYSERLHDLRKTGKKLRYLLEAFRSLYSQSEVERVVRRLRKLQNTLGEIVDRHVQNGCLLAWGKELSDSGDIDETELAAIRRLAEACARRQAVAEPKFEARFERYLEAARSGVLRGVPTGRK